MTCKYKYKDNWYSEEEVKKLISNDISIENVLLEFTNRMSYTVEINTAKDNISYRVEPHKEFDPDTHEYEDAGYAVYTPDSIEPKYIVGTKEEAERLGKKEGRNTQHYSNLTVPGGTNGSYIEANIETPVIVPSIQSHAQFRTDNTIGWMRADEKQNYQEKDIDNLIEIMKRSGILEVNCG